MGDTVFDKIVSGEITSYVIWEDDNFLAFLTPFPNTPGASVVIPKKNPGDNVFKIDDNDYLALLKASKLVAKLLEKQLDVPRVALVIEGTGVPYAHVKLFPLHGELASKTDFVGDETTFNENYVGFLTTMEGPLMSADNLSATQKRIIGN